MIGDKQVIALSLGALLLAGVTLYPVWHPMKDKGRTGALPKAPADQNSGLASDANSSAQAPGRGDSSPPPSVASEQQRLIRALEQAINTGDPAAAESLFWKYLPTLLSNGGAPMAENVVAGTPRGPMRDCLLRVLATAWASRDAVAALAWTARLPDKRERDEAYDHVLSSLAEAEPARAVRLAAAQTEAEEAERTARVERLIQSWARLDFPDSREWVLSQPAGEQRNRWTARIAAVQAINSPQDAARFALEQIPDGPIQEEAVISVVYSWAERDPSAAQEWVRSFASGPLRARALNEVQGLAATPSTQQPAATEEPATTRPMD